MNDENLKTKDKIILKIIKNFYENRNFVLVTIKH